MSLAILLVEWLLELRPPQTRQTGRIALRRSLALRTQQQPAAADRRLHQRQPPPSTAAGVASSSHRCAELPFTCVRGTMIAPAAGQPLGMLAAAADELAAAALLADHNACGARSLVAIICLLASFSFPCSSRCCSEALAAPSAPALAAPATPAAPAKAHCLARSLSLAACSAFVHRPPLLPALACLPACCPRARRRSSSSSCWPRRPRTRPRARESLPLSAPSVSGFACTGAIQLCRPRRHP